mgnify:CR=1 FL=1
MMKKIKLYDYQQKMLEDIINVLTTAVSGTFYNENGKHPTPILAV